MNEVNMQTMLSPKQWEEGDDDERNETKQKAIYTRTMAIASKKTHVLAKANISDSMYI